MKVSLLGNGNVEINRNIGAIIMSKIVFIGFAILFNVVTSFGQTAAGFTSNGLAPGRPDGSYDASPFESINYFNGNMSFSLPSLGLDGRGSADTSIPLNIDRTWDIYTYDSSGTGSGIWVDMPQVEAYTTVPRYHLGFMESKQSATPQSPCPTSDAWAYGWTLTRLVFTAPDGTRTEFVDNSYGGQPFSWNTCVPDMIGISRGTIFKTKDGSDSTFISDSAIMENAVHSVGGGLPSGYLYLRDGTKYRFDGGSVSWITDRNGNKTTFSAGTITDSLGRQITITSDVNESAPYGLCDKFEYKGTDGETRTIRVSKKYLTNALRSDQSLQNNGQLFGVSSYGNEYTANLVLLPTAVWLPNGQKYTLSYNSYAELARVELPSGAAIEYDYASGDVSESNGGYVSGTGYGYIYRRLVERRTYADGTTLSHKLTIDRLPSSGSFTVREKDGSNNLIRMSKHYFHGEPDFVTPFSFGTYYDHWQNGKEYKVEHYDFDGTTKLATLETLWEQPSAPSWWNNYTGYGPEPGNNVRVQKVTQTQHLASSTLVSKTEYSYDSVNNVADVYEYDFGSSSAGALLRRSHTDYVTSSNYTSETGPHLRSLPSQTWISSDSAGSSKFSRAVYEYDNYANDSNHAGLVSRSSVTGHDSSNYGTGLNYRGNTTAVKNYANAGASSGEIVAYSQYDMLGNVVKTIDMNGNATTISYADNFGTADSNATTNSTPSQISGLSTFAFPTSTTNPLSWTAYTQYDYFTGAAVNTQDINGLISKTIYDDDLDRPTQTVSAIGVSEIQTTIDYIDDERRVEQTSDLFTLNDNLKKTERRYDGLGRTTETIDYTDGDYVSVKMEYDALNHVSKVSNPYRPSRSETALWTETTYDSLGRVTEVETPDTAKVITAYDGNRVLVTDQAGKQRISKMNSLGHLKDVWEVTASDANTESVSFPSQSLSAGYKTSYTSDVLGNLLTVTQGVQTRTFVYDSLSRITSAANPESGTITYTYDSNGNPKTKRDARNIKTVYDYDALNRVTKRCYRSIGTGSLGMTTCVSNSETQESNTSDITFTHEDTNITNLKGVLTKVSNGVSMTEYSDFDAVGRVTESKQTTDSTVYGPMTYIYNLSGALTEQSYPSGRVVKNTLDADGNFQQVQSRRSSDTFRNNANRFTYNPNGSLTSVRLGNGRWETTEYNSRQQARKVGLGASAGHTGIWQVDYELGELQTNGTVDATKNSGNVAKQTIIVPNVGTNTGFTAVQSFTFDQLDRLKVAKEVVGSTTKWQQTYLYDRYSNRRFDATNTTTINTQLPTNQSNPGADDDNNKFTESDDYFYDASGNLIEDAFGNRFEYDAHGKTSKFFDEANSSSDPDAVYTYDGEDRRVKKVADGITTIFVFDATGKMVAEYSNETPTSSPAITYVTMDDYDNPRIMTDGVGQVTQRRDYMPFGEQLSAGSGERTTGLGYTSDTRVRQGYASKDKDEETGFNYFGERYYSSAVGRFTSPDTLMASGGASNPQTWNRYAYVVNNPVAYVDVNGELKRDKNGKVKIFKYQFASVGHASGVSSSGFEIEIETDKGRRVKAFMNSAVPSMLGMRNSRTRQKFDFNTRHNFNCHGLTFAQGQFAISNDQVARILEDDYTRVDIASGATPQAADVVIYFDSREITPENPRGIVHSATVSITDV